MDKHEMHGGCHTRLYRIWANIKTRCLNEHDPHYKNWGGRGVQICSEWKESFSSFRDWAISHGYADTLTIDRINNDGNYCPENCRWVTNEDNVENNSQAILLTYNGETHSLGRWERILGTGKNTVQNRHKRGWSVEECLFGRKKVMK